MQQNSHQKRFLPRNVRQNGDSFPRGENANFPRGENTREFLHVLFARARAFSKFQRENNFEINKNEPQQQIDSTWRFQNSKKPRIVTSLNLYSEMAGFFKKNQFFQGSIQ